MKINVKDHKSHEIYSNVRLLRVPETRHSMLCTGS